MICSCEFCQYNFIPKGLVGHIILKQARSNLEIPKYFCTEGNCKGLPCVQLCVQYPGKKKKKKAFKEHNKVYAIYQVGTTLMPSCGTKIF